MRPGLRLGLAGICLLLSLTLLAAGEDHCDVCGEPLTGHVFILQDKLDQTKHQVCPECALSRPRCFLCGLPTNKNSTTELPDGRVLCERDAKTAVLTTEDGLRICRETKAALDRLFSRFLSLPETNVTVSVVDRVNLQELFRFPGNDYPCPNIWGYLDTKTNGSALSFEISLMSGLPLAGFKATAAHEYTHAWVRENLTPQRRATLARDAEEGFCELIGYLLLDSLQEEAQKQLLLLNTYTRGQIHLFIEAKRRFGLNDVAEWMKFGIDDRLNADDLGRIRKVQMPPARVFAAQSGPAPVPTDAAPAPAGRSSLSLQAIFWREHAPLALINDHTFAVQDQARVRVGGTNLTLRCLDIRRDAVRVQVVGTGLEQELALPSH